MIDPKIIQEKLLALREDYRKNLPGRLAEITTVWGTLSQNWDKEALQNVQRYVHTLAGSGATFGYAEITSTALELNSALKHIDATNSVSHDTLYAAITGKIKALEQVCNEACTSEGAAGTSDSLDTIHQPSDEKNADVVLLVNVDTSSTLNDEQLQKYHYQLQRCDLLTIDSVPEIVRHIEKHNPAIVIYDVDDFNADNKALIGELNRHLNRDIPTIFVSQHGETEHRLAGVRLGGDAYFLKPVDTGALVERLDSYGRNQNSDPYCIMIIEDSPNVAKTYSIYLEMAGMHTRVITDPMKVGEALCEFRPDLILLDMYMPNCSGPELAMVIRQTGTFTSVPIVFLSMESDITQQLNAMRRGGDDFLTKPITPEHLVSAVNIRAKRYRDLRTYIYRDGMTGLLNHSKTVEQLQVEISRAERSREPLAYVMVDIDHFKSINDTYGHAAGDQVIRSLAHLLQRSVRNTDIVGRYGGEEFALILYGTDWEPAFDVMENLRKDFEKMEFTFNNQIVKATFSCGIAVYPHIKEINTLQTEADKALYIAKNQGRNRTSLSDPTLKFD